MSTRPIPESPEHALASIMDIARAALGVERVGHQPLEKIFNVGGTAPAVAEPKRRPAPLRAKALYAARRRRERIFGANGELFGDPCWDILLDLYVAEHEPRTVSISSACIAACVAQTTALRWIASLEGRGLLERKNDPQDGRRSYLRLTAVGLRLMEEALVQF